MQLHPYFISVIIGYLLGSSNLAYFISRIKKVNLREGGSANLGASNATILLGKRAGVMVLLHDVLKTVLAVFICKYLFPVAAYCGITAGVASVLGHIFPFYLSFKGGKGFASYVGLIFALDWKFALCMILIVVAVSLLFDWIVAGTFATISISPLYLAVIGNRIACGILLVASICIFLKHLENIRRKCQGKEIGIRATLFKKR